MPQYEHSIKWAQHANICTPIIVYQIMCVGVSHLAWYDCITKSIMTYWWRENNSFSMYYKMQLLAEAQAERNIHEYFSIQPLKWMKT